MKLQYCKLIQHNSGLTKVLTEKGEEVGVPNEDIMVTLNKFGNEGWEVISGGPNSDSIGVRYLLKREKKEDGSSDALTGILQTGWRMIERSTGGKFHSFL